MADNNVYYDLDLKGSVIKDYLKQIPNKLDILNGAADRLTIVSMAEGNSAATTVSYVLDSIDRLVKINKTEHTIEANGKTMKCIVPEDFVAAGDLLVGASSGARYARLLKGEAGKVLKSTSEGLAWGDETIKTVETIGTGNAFTSLELVGTAIRGTKGENFAIDDEVIHNTIFQAAGDILVGTGAGTYTTLAKSSTAGQVLKTTAAGYTWASEPTLSITTTGSGNAITDITVNDHAITATKGTTFATAQSVTNLSNNIGGLVNTLGTQATFSYNNGELTITINPVQPVWPN